METNFKNNMETNMEPITTYKEVEHDKQVCFLRVFHYLQELVEEDSKARKILIVHKALRELRHLI